MLGVSGESDDTDGMGKTAFLVTLGLLAMLAVAACQSTPAAPSRSDDARAAADPTPTPGTPDDAVPPNPDRQPTPTPQAVDDGTPASVDGPALARSADPPGRASACEDTGAPTFAASPLAIEHIVDIEPMGRMAGSHVTPTDHLYIRSDPTATEIGYDVYAPAAGRVVEVQRFSDYMTVPRTDRTVAHYRVVIEHSCTFSSIYIHVTDLAESVTEVVGDLPSGEYWSTRGAGIPLEAGEIFAKSAGYSFDFSVHDYEVTLPGFVLPERYGAEPWKVHTMDPFDYYEEPLRSELIAKSLRQVEPFGGKIDHDVDGRLAGNWFLDGTVDYSGNVAPGTYGYWTGHLALAYDYIDPAQVRFSIGADVGIDADACRTCNGVYAVLGNSPDPATVGPDSGAVSYVLVGFRHVEPEVWTPSFFPAATIAVETQVLGTALAELVDERTLRFQVFSGESSAPETGFTDAASIYRR